ncbi:MAG: Rieske 2Fe-2S domain-containing protein [Bacteroidetes bacterium]|nr:Rieske 2Fe-2S domain-containing protein [Bacteroidota bacterium]MCL1968624.1 Rieske 2Fe-2S domain-containing protein [Bacteroidota bacterium]
MKHVKYIFFAILFGLAAKCGNGDYPIPRVLFNFYVYPDEVTCLNLNYIGGHEYFTGGVSGVVVYRLSDWEFTAFDRACPHDWDDPDSWIWVEEDGITLKCQNCGSLFNILDGSVIIGPSKYPLRQYYTKYDGVRLRVHS